MSHLIKVLVIVIICLLQTVFFSIDVSSSSAVRSWSVRDVQHWLSSIGLSDYGAAFEREAIDGEVLTELTVDEFNLLGITKLGHRKKLEKEINKIKQQSQHDISKTTTTTSTKPIPMKTTSPSIDETPINIAIDPVEDNIPSSIHDVFPSSPTSRIKATSKTPSRPSPPSAPPTNNAAEAFTQAAKQAKKKKRKGSKTGMGGAAPTKRKNKFIPSGNKNQHRYSSHRDPASVQLSAADRADIVEWLRLGLASHQSGDLDAARSYYERVLAIDPFHARALHMLGLIVMVAEQNPNEAIAILEYSISISDDSDTHINLGNFYWQMKQNDRAMEHWEIALSHSVVAGGVQTRARFADTAYHSAMQAYQEGNLERCKSLLLTALRLAIEADALHYPVDHEPPTYQYPNAVEFKRQNLEVTHQYRMIMADSWLHIGLLEQEESPAVALACYNKALEIIPDPLDSEKAQGVQIATILGETQGYRQALLGRHRNSITEKAMTRAQSVIEGYMVDRSDGRYKKLVENLHKTCHFSQAALIARLIIDDVIFHSPDYKFLYSSNSEITQEREKYNNALSVLLNDKQLYNLWNQPHGLEWCRFRFYLAYHGLNNKELNTKLANVYLNLSPSLDYTAPYLRKGSTIPYDGRRKIRVGFISAFLTHHPVGRTLQGYIEHLPRDRFEILIFFINLQPNVEKDPLLLQMQKWADRYVVLPVERTLIIRDLIETEKPDVLLYGDIGMEPTSFFISFSRLAPIQALTFGHPDTSGVPNMDYFISHVNMDQPNNIGQEFYTEKLVSLPGIGYWHKAEVPHRMMSREEVGLADRQLGLSLPPGTAATITSPASKYSWTMYLVTKSIQFYSPDFVDALAEILTRHPTSFLALLVDIGRISRGFDLHNECQESILDGIELRLLQYRDTGKIDQNSYEDYRSEYDRNRLSGRVRFVDKGDHDYFMSLLSMTDVLLQPIPLDGTTTTLEALSIATPTVLYEGPMIGGRMGSAIYEYMGVTDIIGHSIAEYIDIAVRLGRDRSFNEYIRQQLRTQQDEKKVWQNPQAITAFADWIQTAVREKMS